MRGRKVGQKEENFREGKEGIFGKREGRRKKG
jgi:hypothetical protein